MVRESIETQAKITMRESFEKIRENSAKVLRKFGENQNKNREKIPKIKKNNFEKISRKSN